MVDKLNNSNKPLATNNEASYSKILSSQQRKKIKIIKNFSKELGFECLAEYFHNEFK